MSSQNIKSKNHFVPRHYLNNWLNESGELFVYNLLVPNESYPIWNSTTPSKFGYRYHLYTSFENTKETDEMENWLESEFETPAAPIIEKVIFNKRISPEEWKILIRYAACQSVRTPASYIKFTSLGRKLMPESLNETFYDLINNRKLNMAPSDFVTISKEEKKLSSRFKHSLIKDESGQQFLKVETVFDRQFWLNEVRRILSHTYKVLLNHKWTILCPPDGINWYTSDNPVVRLSYSSEKKYNLDGGWGVKGCEIIFPLSPNHMLYTLIGKKSFQRNHIIDRIKANQLNRILVENAHLHVISNNSDLKIQSIRKRTVDLELFNRNKKNWEEWHKTQSNSHMDFEFTR